MTSSLWTKSGNSLQFVKKVRVITVIKVFTIGFNGENGFFSHYKNFNVYRYKDNKTEKIVFTVLESVFFALRYVPPLLSPLHSPVSMET